jgi:hypothetical protein
VWYLNTTVCSSLYAVYLRLSGQAPSYAASKQWWKEQLRTWPQKWLQEKLSALRQAQQDWQAELLQLDQDAQRVAVERQQWDADHPEHPDQQQQHHKARAEIAAWIQQLKEQEAQLLREAQKHLPQPAIAAAVEAVTAAAAAADGSISGQADVTPGWDYRWDHYCSLVSEGEQQMQEEQQQGEGILVRDYLPLHVVKQVSVLVTILTCTPCLLPNLERCGKTASCYAPLVEEAAEKCGGQLLFFFDALTDVMKDNNEGYVGVYTEAWFTRFMEVSACSVAIKPKAVRENKSVVCSVISHVLCLVH